MSDPKSSPNKTEILGTFASILGLLGIFLYFTGWIYRWAYFGFFQLEINRLDLPLRSFLFVPIQVFFGDFWAILRTVLTAIALAILIKFTLWLLQPLDASNPRTLGKYPQKLHQWLPFKLLRSLTSIIPLSLRNELITVSWLLVVLFWLARYQGTLDARRDAINDTSTLPVITFVTPEKQIALGRNLDNLLLDPSLKGYRIIGDTTLFDYLRGRETNDISAQETRVWRLLLENSNWLYLFPALSQNVDRRPPILAIREDREGQLMILSPDYPK